MNPRLVSCAGAAVVALTCRPAFAQAPALLPVQGVLADSGGQPLDGAYQVTFTLYDAPTGGVSFFSETMTVEVEAGLFTVYLGGDGGNPLELVNFQMPNTFLGLRVEGNEEMTPRFRLATAPYAGFAEYCGDASSLAGQTTDDFAGSNHSHPWSEVTDAPDFAAASHGHSWSELSDVPADLADGDDDTLYGAGSGLIASGNVFSVDDGYVQRRITQTCPNGGLSQINADGSAVCDTDDDTTYQAGVGVSLSGGRFSVEQYDNLARKDAAAGNQAFNTRTLVLDYSSNNVGINVTNPDETLDVGGDIEFTGQLRPSSNRTFYSYIPANEFQSSSTNVTNAGLYIYPSANLTINGYARMKLPNASTVRTVTCYVYDSGSGRIENFNFYVYRRPYSASSGTIIGSDINTNLNYQDTTVRGFSITNLSETIDYSRNDYYLYYLFDLPSTTTGGFSSYRFYGCRIVYVVDRFSTF